MGSATSNNSNAGDLLVAKRDYHQAKVKLYDLQLQLEEARDNLSDGHRLGEASHHELVSFEEAVYDIENMIALQQAAVDNASRAVGRLIAKQDRRRGAAAGHISDLLFGPGAGLVDIVFFSDDPDAGDPLTPRSLFDDMFGGRSPQDFPPFIRPFMFGDDAPRERESFFESGRRLFGDAAARTFGGMWDKMNADRTADVASGPNTEDGSDSGHDPAS